MESYKKARLIHPKIFCFFLDFFYNLYAIHIVPNVVMELLYVFAQVMYFRLTMIIASLLLFSVFLSTACFHASQIILFCILDCFDDLPIMLNSIFIRFMHSCN